MQTRRIINIVKFKILKNYKIFIWILIPLLLGIISIGYSFGFLKTSFSNNIIKGKISDISSADVKINLYIENRSNGIGNNTYSIIPDVPISGYQFNPEKSNCLNGSLYSYDKDSREFSLEYSTEDNCNFYFDAEGVIDEEINIFLQNRKDGVAINNSYSAVFHVPLAGYEFNTTKSSCNNITYIYNSNTHDFDLETTGRGKCDFYFDSISSTDVVIKIYSKKNCETRCTYKEVKSVPTFKTFNPEKSNCSNGTISFDGTDLTIDVIGKGTCNAYFD